MQRKTLLQLFFPIYFETLFYMLAGIIDTLMVSSVGDTAVGAIGTAGTYISVFIMMYAIISNGMMAVMTQNIGANRPGVACQARNLGLGFNMVFGLLLSAVLFFGSDLILTTIGISQALYEPASTYLKIVGGCSFLNAILPIASGYLRAFGYTKQPMLAAVIGNVVNLILNAVFLFAFDMGVAGVAWATVISRVVNLAIVAICAHRLIDSSGYTERIGSLTLFKQIISIGLPSALETIVYNLCMTFVIKFLNQMDSEGFNVTARSYAMQIANFSYCIGAALAASNAIITGWRIGSEEYEEVRKGTRKAAVYGVLIAVVFESCLCLLSPVIMRFFSSDPDMISTVRTLLFIDIFLEIGRVTNLVYVQALKTSGDAVYPVIIAIIFMFICQVLGSYLFGIRLGYLVIGAYIALSLDECARAVMFILRFRSGKWMEKKLV